MKKILAILSFMLMVLIAVLFSISHERLNAFEKFDEKLIKIWIEEYRLWLEFDKGLKLYTPLENRYVQIYPDVCDEAEWAQWISQGYLEVHIESERLEKKRFVDMLKKYRVLREVKEKKSRTVKNENIFINFSETPDKFRFGQDDFTVIFKNGFELRITWDGVRIYPNVIFNSESIKWKPGVFGRRGYFKIKVKKGRLEGPGFEKVIKRLRELNVLYDSERFFKSFSQLFRYN